MGRGQPHGQYQLPCSHQDPLANMQTLLWKHKELERGLEAQAEKMSALEATAHRLQRGGHPQAQSALGRCQAVLLRYLWLWAEGSRGWAGVGMGHLALPFLPFCLLTQTH